MSRQGRTARPTRGRTSIAQAGAAELVMQRAAYDGMSPGDPGFDDAFGAAEDAAVLVETHMRRMSRPDGSSRRAAAERFVAATAVRDTGYVTLPAYETAPQSYQAIGTAGAIAIGGFGLEVA
jgi:hypothetical protein